MNLIEKLPKFLIITILIAGAGLVTSRFFTSKADTALATVTIPELSPLAQAGKKTFDISCASCHGANGAGSDKGPPLVHNIYNPGHHDDPSFFRAATQGVPAHHWRFGNMPPQPQVSETDVAAIVRYIRELQTANGIFYQKHMM